MRAIDTNVLVRLIVRDDENQAAAADAFVEPGAWVSQLVLAESIWVLRSVFDLSGKQQSDVVAMLLAHRSLTVERADVVAAALAQFRASARLSFTDCLVVEIARSAGHVPVGTFDRALARVEGAARL